MYIKGGKEFYDSGDKCEHISKGIVVVVGSCADGDALVKVINPCVGLHGGTSCAAYDRFGARKDPDGTSTYWFASQLSLKYLGGDYDGLDEL